MAELNAAYLKRKGATNVIAFPMQEGDFSSISPELLGDVVISMDTCVREAEVAEMEIEARFDQLLVHGILHLIGYDHETNDSDAERMEAKSVALMQMLAANRQ